MSPDHPIKAWREAQEPKVSQEDFGQRVGADGLSVSRWERGVVVPQRRFQRRILELTGITPSQLVEAVKECA